MAELTLAQRVRYSVYQRFLADSRPPLIEELMSEFALSRHETVAVIRELVESRGLAVVKGTSRILMAWPFSAIPTPFVVRARGKSWYANCSWDAIAFHSMLGEDDVAIDSFCHHCARPIRIDLKSGHATRVDPLSTVVYLELKPAQWWEDIITTCSNTMVFFCSSEHRDASGVPTDPAQTATLTPDQTHRLGIPLYARRLEMDYVRPSRDELNAHFSSLGLTGPYWQI